MRVRIFRTTEPVTMNDWNSIKVFRTGRLGGVTLNEGNSAMGLSPEPRSALTLHTNLMVGGTSQDLRREVQKNAGIHRGFTGYIRNVSYIKIWYIHVNMEIICLTIVMYQI